MPCGKRNTNSSRLFHSIVLYPLSCHSGYPLFANARRCCCTKLSTEKFGSRGFRVDKVDRHTAQVGSCFWKATDYKKQQHQGCNTYVLRQPIIAAHAATGMSTRICYMCANTTCSEVSSQSHNRIPRVFNLQQITAAFGDNISEMWIEIRTG